MGAKLEELVAAALAEARELEDAREILIALVVGRRAGVANLEAWEQADEIVARWTAAEGPAAAPSKVRCPECKAVVSLPELDPLRALEAVASVHCGPEHIVHFATFCVAVAGPGEAQVVPYETPNVTVIDSHAPVFGAGKGPDGNVPG